MSNKIISLKTHDVRFPTSETLAGSDATNKNPDYSAAYVELAAEGGDTGYGLVFTIGRGNDVCCYAIEAMMHLVVGQAVDEIRRAPLAFYQRLKSDSQLRWLGPEKGVIHMAAGAIMNAMWDLLARMEGKPVWRLLSDMSPEEFVDCIDQNSWAIDGFKLMPADRDDRQAAGEVFIKLQGIDGVHVVGMSFDVVGDDADVGMV